MPAGPAGNSLELCRYLPGPIPRLKDHCPVLLGIFLVCRRLPCESSDIQDLFVATSSARPLLYQPVPKVCEYAFKRQYLCCVFLCREQFFNSVSSRGHVWTSWSLKVFVCVCVCVCARHTSKSRTTHRVSFSENSRAFGTVFQELHSFSANLRKDT